MKAMKHSALLIASSLLMAANAFIIPLVEQPKLTPSRPTSFTSQLRMAVESDFGSAMPAKPEMSLEERIQQTATEFIATLTERLGEGVQPPQPELDALKEARDSGAKPDVIATRIYELLIEQGMLYDTDPETGIMTLTEWNIKEHLEAPEVKKEFLYLYQYGMGLIAKGYVGIDEVKNIVKERLIDRTGKTPEEFDKWLGF
jgi:hypothetical protein